ncbi:MAG: hypothetical protein LIO78_07430 [Clostridiales bacterium]|nr:hypothetical protein [Clostridiales bacterium]
MKKGWQAATALALAVLCGSSLMPSAAAVELDLNGIYEHPVRVAVGVVCLVAAIVLLLYRVLRHPMDSARRSRSYGGDKAAQGTPMEPYRRSRRKKRVGGGVFGLLLPSYKGRKQAQPGPSVSVAVPERHRASRRRSTASPIRGFSNRSYKGGNSAAGAASLRSVQPDSYKSPWGSRSRYGRLRLQAGGKRYQGGGSAAGTANLRSAQPDSYKAPWGSKGRYGRLRLQTGGKRYQGGGSAAGAANLRSVQPDSYKAPWGSRSRYGRLRLQTGGKRYQGGSAAGAADLRTPQPDSYREPWGGKKRYGRFALPAIPIPYLGRKKGPDGAVPGPHTPARHTGKGLFRPAPAKVTYAEPERYRDRFGLRRRYGMKNPRDEIPIYHGGSHVLRAARVALAAPPSYREPWGSRRRYGTQTVMDWLPVYRGSVSIARSRHSAPALPLSYREPWGSRARYGKGVVPPELPLSYREPWGQKGRYGQEPRDYEPPLSYREPWGLLRRYGAGDPLERTALPLPTPYLGGSTTTAKEPWIDPDTGRLAEPVQPSAKQYGNRRYGGKLYGGRIVHYREEEPLDSSTVVHGEADGLQAAAQTSAAEDT